jgi:hypothetical protein
MRIAGEEKMPSCGDYIMHFLTLPWKLIFAFIPPTGGSKIPFVFSFIQKTQKLVRKKLKS